jgi:cellulose synthase/poly-beta-1,6-N-acetylglucosamine synthase-like glycosyltransferase
MHVAILLAVRGLAWLISLAWLTRIYSAARGLPTIPDLLLPQYDVTPDGDPSLTVIVPARNEAPQVQACLESLLAQDYRHLRILAINDRSTDHTGSLMDTLAAAHPGRLSVLHIETLPTGWLGKTHAMALAARHVDTDFLLFTDADVLFHPSALRRALVNVQATQADHFVLFPTTIIRRWDESALLSFFQIFGLWAARPWRIADPKARHDVIGIGAFNLIRRTAYIGIGGFDAFPMEIVEDLGLGRRVKYAGLRQRVAFGRDLVSVHWASGARGLIHVMTKNVFSIFNFHVSLLLLGCVWVFCFAVAPFLALPLGTAYVPGLGLPAGIVIVCIFAGYGLMSRRSGLSPWNAFLSPFAAMLFIYTLLRSMLTTLRQRGVFWRGTFYPLAELRAHMVPLFRRK